ncbi:DUF1501 domain-containing protein [Salinibacterium sp. SWN1162]|uniref:DUF1501 domain-containing protein n=1 Tax=Salinibacterium sp. SWN1162 TaxID=2792053 RepID=UPI0018CCD367|nr:DUF1501 domain-containing protein [Salinibacterium sp. SWN1162]MBH0007744.1 DUF1501 domain-containing protein [Salinibacterium sp. SWN1162]
MTDTRFLHPDCPDWRQLGPTDLDSAVRAHSEIVVAEEQARRHLWSKGFTRRRMLQGGLMAGVAAVGSQIVTTQASYAAPGAPDTGALIVVFLRGGMDGLSVLVPATDADLLNARPGIAVRENSGLIPFQRGFGLHPALAALKPMLAKGKIAAVPAIGTPDLSRSHFQAQDCLERGGSAGSASQTGWLNRALEQSGPGTTWRGVGASDRLARSLVGDSNALVVPDLDRLAIDVDDSVLEPTRTALANLYTGLDHPFAQQTTLALSASREAAAIAASAGDAEDRGFGDDNFSSDLATLSSLIKANVGLRVGTLDLGGWDMHTDIGTPDKGDMHDMLKAVGDGLAAFFADLGPKAETTTVVLMSEFGRRVGQNDSSGADHGHGGLAMVLGGGVKGGVHGKWEGLGADVLDHGDVPGSNDFRDLLGEVVMNRLDLSAADASVIFPDWKVAPIGVMA